MVHLSLRSHGTHNCKRTRTSAFLQLGICAALFMLLAAGPSAVVAQTTIYVDTDAAGADNGTSWGDAYADLQSALTSAVSGDQIWVAEGTYKPSEDPFGNTSPADLRDKTFYVRDGISIYGGFAGNETTLSERTIAANTTTLSGDFNGDDVVTGSGTTLSITNNAENAYHVVISSGSTGVTIDGFTVTGGNANGPSTIEVNGASIPRAGGGGMYAREGTNTLTNNTLLGNYATEGGGTNILTDNTLSENLASSGGGIYTGAGTNTLTNNTVSGNKANSNGGGIFTIFGTNILTNNNLSGNSAASGGGIYARQGTNTLTDNTLSVNTASNSGGGMYNDDSSPTVTTSIFSGNTSGSDGGGMFNNGGSPNLTSVTFVNNGATLYGGGMNNSFGSAVLTDVTFTSNSASLGGGGMANAVAECTMEILPLR